jgi:hypothetical protein
MSCLAGRAFDAVGIENAGGDADSILDDALEPRGGRGLISSSLRKGT